MKGSGEVARHATGRSDAFLPPPLHVLPLSVLQLHTLGIPMAHNIPPRDAETSRAGKPAPPDVENATPCDAARVGLAALGSRLWMFHGIRSCMLACTYVRVAGMD